MATFACQSRDGAGKIVRKTVDAESRRDAIAILEGAGLFPIEIKAVMEEALAAPAREGSLSTPHAGGERVDARIPGKELLNFSIQLGSSIRAGVPILGALQAIARQTRLPALRSILAQMGSDLEGGVSLSGSMRKHPRAFSTVYSSTVAAGEQSGSLEEVLENLAEFVEADMELRSDVRSALLYPSIVVVTLLLAISVLIVFVVPRFTGFYAGFNTELPLPTRILIGISSAATTYWPLFLGGLAALGFAARAALQRQAGRELLEKVLLRTPVVSHFLITASTLRVTQMLALFTRAGVPILEGLGTLAATSSNFQMRKKLLHVAAEVASGKTLGDSLENAECLPPAARQMIGTGESMGSLEESCDAVTRQFKKELRYLTKNLATLIEPVMTVMLAVVVLFVALAVFLPMWDMVKVIRK